MKIKIKVIISCILLSITLSCATAGKPVETGIPLENNPAIVSGILDNGLSYHILHNKYPENRIFLRLAVKIGSLVEAENERGLAHFVEHMAFNGSTHFGANELISYFESIGMAFGADVNAFTSFDETVYMLEIPADNPEALTISLKVIADWAGGLTFDPAIVDKERGVIMEEWRLNRGSSGRILDALTPFLFPFSRYANRLPIGKTSVILKAPRNRIVNFYQKWYRPDLMSVIIVGDADAARLEGALRDHLSLIPAGTKKPKRPEYAVSASKTKMSLHITDPETPYTEVFIGSIYPALMLRTAEEYRLFIARELSLAILNSRLQELVEDKNYLEAAESFQSDILVTMSMDTAFFKPKDGEFTQTFTSVLDVLDQFAQFGVTETELERAKADRQSQSFDDWQNQDTLESSWLADQLVENALYHIPVLSPDHKFRLESAVIQTITAAEINQVITQYYSDRGSRMVVVSSPEAGVPGKKTLDKVWKKYQNKSLAPYQDTLDPRPLFPPALAGQPGSITGERILAQGPKGPITELTLSNGAVVVICPTDFKKDSFLFNAVSRGGLSLLEDDQYPSAKYADYYAERSGLNGFKETEVAKKLAGTNMVVEPILENLSAELQGYAAARDMESLLQVVNLYFTAPHFSASAWDRTKSHVQDRIANIQKQPLGALYETLGKTLYDNNIRLTLPTSRFLNNMNPAQSEEAYTRFFKEGGNFTFIFTGDVDLETVKQLSIRYLASLPGATEKTEARNIFPSFPQGRQTVQVRKGIEPLGVVSVNFGGENPEIEGDIQTEQELVSAMTTLIELRLRDTIREQLGAAYGVYVQFTQHNYPVRRYAGEISFGCDPDRAEELSALVIRELQRIGESPAAGEDVAKLRENFIRARETNLKTNGFWHDTLVSNYRRGEASARFSDAETVMAGLTGETLSRLIRRYGNPDRYVTGILLPE